MYTTHVYNFMQQGGDEPVNLHAYWKQDQNNGGPLHWTAAPVAGVAKKKFGPFLPAWEYDA